MSFAGRLVAGTVLVLVFTMLVLVWVSERALRRDLERDAGYMLEREARLVSEALPVNPAAWQATVRRLARQTSHRITLIDPTGRVLADSDFPEGPLPPIANHATRPEVREALAGRTGFATRVSETIGGRLFYAAIPTRPGVVRVAATNVQVDAAVRQARRAILGAALLALIVGSVLALIAGRSIAQPLTALAHAARAIAAGSPPRFPRSGIPEIDLLVQALREMHRQLADRIAELTQQQANSTALVESMVEGVIASDEQGRIVTANAAARRLLGYADDQPLPELRQLFRAKAARAMVDAVLDGPDSFRSDEVDLDGKTFLFSARRLPAGGAVLVLHDLTEIRRLEAVRRDFVANVSHEMRTPLTSISGYAETLLTDRPDPETAARFLEVILINARRMQRLVDDLLDLARLEAGRHQLRKEPVDVAEAAREVWDSMAERARAADVSFALDIAPEARRILADADALRQILTNLIDNALRYTPPGGRITCRAAAADGGVTVCLEDTGSGIASDHLPRIFERFYRADPSRSRTEGGTGLGLAIVKHLVEAHRGRVWAESERGMGTRVMAWFPG
ncbi:MAG: ATP-binding protein [Gemmatimonadota bacterium]